VPVTFHQMDFLIDDMSVGGMLGCASDVKAGVDEDRQGGVRLARASDEAQLLTSNRQRVRAGGDRTELSAFPPQSPSVLN